ncbi:hypothetical protein JHK85_014714 [Glycine max]|nr:hypothetical protein JHK85_014714 [Glycine max]
MNPRGKYQTRSSLAKTTICKMKVDSHLQSVDRVDRHPQYRQSRCLFVVRTDGGWIDFSYQKWLREYIRDKYPTHAER